MSRRIALVGIDGSGKSTLARRLIDSLPPREGLVMTCPAYHDTANAPLTELSRELDRFSQTADKLGSFELKATALYLQMTLFGPVESFLERTFAPRYLITERHAIIDSLAYGPFYTGMIQERSEPEKLEGQLESELGDSLGAVLGWHRSEIERLGLEVDFWRLALHVRELFLLPRERLIAELGLRYRTSLPDAVILLDVPMATARERLSQRKAAELHEEQRFLERLRQSYQRVIEELRMAHPDVQTHVVDNSAGLEETLEEVRKLAHWLETAA